MRAIVLEWGAAQIATAKDAQLNATRKTAGLPAQATVALQIAKKKNAAFVAQKTVAALIATAQNVLLGALAVNVHKIVLALTAAFVA